MRARGCCPEPTIPAGRIVRTGLTGLALLLALAAAPALGAEPDDAGPALDAEACVRIALDKSPTIGEARGKVAEWRARLAEVEALYYPKLNVLGWIAPMFTVEGTAMEHDVRRKWKNISDWGPYTHLEATLAQPLYTFGRLDAGADAAQARVEVEEARLRETRHAVAFEVRKLYYLRLYALSMLPTLETAQKIATEAREKAQEMYDEGTGGATQVDLNKLDYGLAEVARYLRMARDGAEMAERGLKHTMGLGPNAEVRFAEDRLSRSLPEIISFADALAEAGQQRPEWTQIKAGLRATRSLEKAEELANAPIIALAGIFEGSYTPTRQDTPNPYHYDQYNDIFGGVALVVKWDLDYWGAEAKADGARAQRVQVEALKQYAESGIPTQVFQAHQALEQHCGLVATAKKGVKATQKWQVFAAAAYKTGTGEARDLLEGLVASLRAKESYYQELRDCWVGHAELWRVMGRETPKPE